MIFIDTSAFYAIMVRSDANHAPAASEWKNLVQQGEPLVTTNYILLETVALLQNRQGMAAVQDFISLTEHLDTHWIGPELHRRAVMTFLVAGRRNLSLADCTSFEAMRSLGVTTAFTFDAHFTGQGFQQIP
jgi:predicted nucleic acid-binding protein